MIFKRKDLTMRRLEEGDIELVRLHRNSAFIRQYMDYREEITPEMQLKWFHSINNNENLYLFIEYKGDPIGLVNAKNISWDNLTTEGGIFIWDKRYINSPVALLTAMTFGELAANVFHLRAIARILKTNKRAIRYNKLIGFELAEGQEHKINQLYVFSGEKFLRFTKVFRGFLLMLYGKDPIIIEITAQDYAAGFGRLAEQNIDLTRIDRVEDIAGGGKRFYYTPT
ncbi:MAG: GNAT family N-acetyltransferase [Bacteroidetes bacterium]|nr:GNAT family N-acetyltransferase [Bacteroidota bacterium]